MTAAPLPKDALTDGPANAPALALFGFAALVAGAARSRPDGPAFQDDHAGCTDVASYADLHDRVAACRARIRACDLAPGETVLICAPPGAQGFALLTAALAAGLEPVLAPLPLSLPLPLPPRAAILRAAARLSPAALFAPAQFCGLDFETALLDLAARTPSLRLIGTLGGALDGAVDFSAPALARLPGPGARIRQDLTEGDLTEEDGSEGDWSAGDMPHIRALDAGGATHRVTQGALMRAALDLVRATRPGAAAPILSLCAPSSPAALVAGPLAALLAGAPLHSLAPFDSARFLEKLAALGPARLIAPAAVLSDLAGAGLLTNGALVGVTAIGAVVAAIPEGACPIVALRNHAGAVTLETVAPAMGRVAAA